MDSDLDKGVVVPAATQVSTLPPAHISAVPEVAQVATSVIDHQPVDHKLLVGRRILNKKKFFKLNDQGVVVVTVHAFREDRPGGLSTDVLWERDSAQRATKRVRTIEASKTCAVEGHDIVGWAALKVGDLTTDLKMAIAGVWHTPQPTNQQHADVISHDFLAIRETDAKEEAGLKADLVAKLLYDFSQSKGTVIGTIDVSMD